MHKQFSVPTLLVLGMVLILSSVSLVTNQSPVKVSVSKPISKAAIPINPKFDLNKDGKVSNLDIAFVSNIITGNDASGYNASYDVNKDGKITIDDVALIRQYLYPRDKKAYFDLNLDTPRGIVDNFDVNMIAGSFFGPRALDPYYNLTLGYPKPAAGYDTKVDLKDLVMIRKYLYSADKKAYFDLDHNRVVDNRDVQLVIVGMGMDDYYVDINFVDFFVPVDMFDVQMIGTYVFDLNSDGLANKADQDLLGNVLLGSVRCPVGKNCDFNGDGSIKAADLTILISYILNYAE